MSAFTDMVASDRDSVFLNLDEYSEEHDIDGKVIKVVLENVSIEEKDNTQALSEATYRLYAKTEELNGRKMAGETLYIDDVGYTVKSWLDNMGITTVILELPASY